jgi:hypothetical protein
MKIVQLLRLMGPKRIIPLFVMAAGVLMMMLSERLFLLGGLLGLVAWIALRLSSKRRKIETPALPIRERVLLGLIPLVAIVGGAAITFLFPKNPLLGQWIGILVTLLGIGFGFWVVVFRQRPRTDKERGGGGP